MRVKTKKFRFLILFLLIPFMFPDSLTRIHFVNLVIKGWKLLAGSYAAIYSLKRVKLSIPVLALSLFYLLLTFSALFQGNFNIDWLMFLAFLWIIEYCSNNRLRMETFLNTYVKLGGVLIVINLLSMIAFPKGLYSTTAYDLNWFLGYKNIIIRKTLPITVALLVNCKLHKRKLTKTEILIFGSGIAGVVLSQSANAWVGLAIFLVLLLLIHFEKFPKWINLQKIFIVYVVIDVVMLNMDDIIWRFRGLLVGVLDKNGSMLGRIAIWSRTKEIIKDSPIIGYGEVNSNWYHFTFSISHPHNLLLYYLVLGGIVGIIILFFAMNRIDRGRRIYETELTSSINVIFMASYISYFSMGLFESLIGATFFLPFMLLMYNINREVFSNDRSLHSI